MTRTTRFAIEIVNILDALIFAWHKRTSYRRSAPWGVS